MLSALIVLGLFGNVIAASMKNAGPCPKLETMKDFDMSKFMGEWWIGAHSITAAYSKDKCTKMVFTPDGNGTVSVITSSINRASGEQTISPSILYIGDPADHAKMTQQNYGSSYIGIFWILDTDYEKYAVLYRCNDIIQEHFKRVFFFIREQKPSETVFAKLDEIIEKYDFDKPSFRKIKQEECVLRPS